MNTTQEQKEILLEWMKQHPDVARGRLRRKGESKHQMEVLLQELSTSMNSVVYGPKKSSMEWIKVINFNL
ncbi:hypothetical protein PUN28_019398 [Cardiocondyla obscurior]|uniref:Uncharacterized protein n=1 Tax=Cardiocondyla obscurior TaxID=286306 RepID=A0AAW2EH64_9HYME